MFKNAYINQVASENPTRPKSYGSIRQQKLLTDSTRSGSTTLPALKRLAISLVVSLACDVTDLALWVRSLWFSGVEPEAGGEGCLAPTRVARRIHSLTCMPEEWSQSVLRIRDLYPGSRFFIHPWIPGSVRTKKRGNFY
jgi:hypothetical protein